MRDRGVGEVDGKISTTLWALHTYLQEEYAVVLMDFQRMSTAIFRDEYTFSKAFMKDFLKVVRNRNMQRTDDIIDYRGKRYIIELKIWRGNAYNEQGEQQLLEYMDAYHLDRGYLLSFCFNKDKEVGVREVKYEDKTLVEAVV